MTIPHDDLDELAQATSRYMHAVAAVRSTLRASIDPAVPNVAAVRRALADEALARAERDAVLRRLEITSDGATAIP